MSFINGLRSRRGGAIAHPILSGFFTALLIVMVASCNQEPVRAEWSYAQFLQAVQQGSVEAVTFTADRSEATVTTQRGEVVQVTIPPNDPDLVNTLSEANIPITVKPAVDNLPLRILFPLLMPLVILVLQVFWIWVLVDCAMKEASEGNTKIVWVIIILFTNLLGALIYFFIRRPERRRELGR